MPDIACPVCGEARRLTGERTADSITITCGTCAHQWTRDPTPRCVLCGSEHLIYAPRPLWERGRGEQRTPAGRIDAYDCPDCGGGDVTSRNPTSPPAS